MKREDPAFVLLLSEALALFRSFCDLIQVDNVKENYSSIPAG